MALVEDVLKGGGMTGLALGLGVIMLGPVLIPAVGRVARPAAKAAVKTGISVYRQTLAGIGEATSSLIEEARRELEDERLALAGAAAGGEGGAGEETGQAGRGRAASRRHA